MNAGAVFWFDFVDPGSYLASTLLCRWTDDPEGLGKVMRPLELRPPSHPLLPPGDPGWSALCRGMEEIAAKEGIPFSPPELVPWTRKAHELALHAAEKGQTIHHLLFRARFEEGRDIGRVDVLVKLAERVGLDGPEVRTVLGVDRFDAAVQEARDEARRHGIHGVPTVVADDRRLEGFRSAAELRAFAEAAGLV